MQTVTLIYNKNTGTILSQHEGEERQFIETIKNVSGYLEAFNCSSFEELEQLIVDLEEQPFVPGNYCINKGKLCTRNTIELSTDASDTENPNGIPEIEGDGTSQAVLTATVMTPDGIVDKSYNGPVRFIAARGKLEAKRGIVEAVNGVARTKLTSAPETVAEFTISASAERCIPASMRFEFY